MRKLNYALLIPMFILFMGLFNISKASHVAGGDIQYTCIGQDSFLITANFFRDCSGINAPNTITATLSSTCGQNFTQVLTLVNPGGTEVSQLCAAEIGNSECNGGSLPGMEQYIYEGIVVLTPPCNTWTISYSVNARNPSVNVPNSQSLNFYVEATLNSQNAPCNNSPTFTAQPIPYVCAGQNVDYSYGVTELDGDSLHFFIDAGGSAQNTPLTYGAGFSVTAPIPGITIDPATGQLNFLVPNTNGNYIVVVCVEEYDPATGLLLGSVCRDIQFIVQTCNNIQPELVAPGIQNFVGTGVQIDSNSVEVCVGNNFSFDIQFSDPDPNDSVFLTHNIATVLPGATVTVTPGNPATLSVSWTATPVPGNFLIFNVQAEDDACPVVGLAGSNFDITIIPATYAGPDQTICQGSQTAQINAVGGSIFTWNVISGDPINPSNFSCNPCANPVASPSVTTTYQVISNLTGTCVNIDTITINVATDYDITLPPDTLICSIQDLQLFANPNLGGQFSWQWTPSSSLNFDTIQNPLANPSENTTYGVTVTSSQGCIKSDTVNVSLSPPFPPNITMGPVDPNDTLLCIGETVDLATNLGDLTPSSCGLATTACIGNTQQSDIGTGTATNTGTSYPAPYGNWYWGARHQMLFTAAELNAAGITGGKITSLAFDVATVGSTQNFQNFEIKMGCTNISQLTSWQTGLATVMPGNTHTVATGWNTHQFATPYDWDGVSNIIIEVCFNNSSFVGNGNSQTRYTPTGFPSVIYYRADNANVCSTAGFTTQSTNRPNVRFNYCTGADPNSFNFTWDVGNGNGPDTTVTPGGQGAGAYDYTVYVADTFGGCVDTISTQIEVVTEFDAGFFFDDPLCLNGGLDTADVIVAGGVFSGPGIIDTAAGVFDPTIPGVGNNPVTYTLFGNCGNDSTIAVEVIPIPDATITSENEYCVAGGPYQLTAATPGGTWSGPGISSGSQGTYDPANLGLGNYMVTYTLTQPCISEDSILIKNILPYQPEIDQVNDIICASDTADTLTVTVPTGGNFGTGPFDITWTGPGIIDPVNGVFNASIAGAGIHTVTVTVSEPNGSCTGDDTYNITVFELPDASFSSVVRCDDITSNQPIIPATPGIGTWTVDPIAPTTGSFNPNQIIPAQLGAGTWFMTYEVTDNNGCFNSFSDTFRIAESPEPPVLDDLSFCADDSLLLSVQSLDPDSVVWYDAETTIRPQDSIGTGVPFNYGLALDPALTGDITVWITQSNFGCESEPIEWVLPIRPSPNADFTVTFTDTTGGVQTVPAGTPATGYAPFGVEFNTISPQPNDAFIWAFWLNCDGSLVNNSACPCPPTIFFDTLGDGSFDPETIYPSQAYTYGCEGVYPAALIVENSFGCRDTATTPIEVLGSERIPNVFTPNGDGNNDRFQVVRTGLVDYKLTIYNRWGRMVYEQGRSCVGGEPGCGWDGSINGGEMANDGIYFWVLVGKTTAGAEIKEKGNVTMIGSSN